ncbi:2Fe-2S iron-sulfur cluster-binding protein [Dactylosporangium sp. CA-092794]|uniref:2Fe-2S iron-sulfur cluster-binding protein n=1 Tax=Dactylosporangium sp. CA-092794 TaxID=3239929 RepID=UPI003D949F34
MNRGNLITAGQVEAIVGQPPAMVMMKQLDRLDAGCVTILAHSPIAGLGYLGGDGHRRATFVGGAPAFTRVHSPRRISFTLPADAPPPPDGTGVGLVFLLPGVGETLRLNGTATAHDRTGLTIKIQQVYVHCARCILRSRLWQPPRAAATGANGVRGFLTASPFLVLSTGDATGGADTSPRGDTPGFARLLGDDTIVIPDRRGNQRADTFHNLVQDDRIALAALRPGHPEVLHVRGTADITDDPELLATMALRGVPPHAALLVRVLDAEVVTSAAVASARLWSPAAHVDRAAVPDLIALASRHAAANTRGATGLMMRAAGTFPRLTRRLIDVGYRTQLAKEGYDGHPDGGPRRMRVAAVRRETPDAVTIVLRGDDPVHFRSGQFFTLVAEVDGQVVRRAYSASSTPGATTLEVTVKHVPGGAFSAYANRRLRKGDRVEVRGPSGRFALEPGDGDLVMIAAGSGITPMMSIIRTTLSGPGHARLALLYGNRSESATLFARELNRLRRRHPDRLTVTHRLTRPAPGWTGDQGRIDAESVERWLDGLTPPATARYYLCGPEPVLAAARAAITARGVPPERIHEERYTSAADDRADFATGPHELNIEQDGQRIATTVVEPGATLLDAGLAAGAPMPYSCTVGNCGECLVKLLAGEVRTSEPNCLTPHQRAEGWTLTCVGRPQSPVTLALTDDEG